MPIDSLTMPGVSEHTNASAVAVRDAVSRLFWPSSSPGGHEASPQNFTPLRGTSTAAVGKRFSPRLERNLNEEVAEKHGASRPHEGREVAVETSSKDARTRLWSRSHASQASQTHDSDLVTDERKPSVFKARPPRPDSATSRLETRPHRRPHTPTTRTVRLVMSLILLGFFLRECAGGQRGSQERSLLSRVSTASSTLNVLPKDRPAAAGMLSSRRLAYEEPPHSPTGAKGSEACSLALRALSSRVVAEAEEEGDPGTQHGNTRLRRPLPSLVLMRYFVVCGCEPLTELQQVTMDDIHFPVIQLSLLVISLRPSRSAVRV